LVGIHTEQIDVLDMIEDAAVHVRSLLSIDVFTIPKYVFLEGSWLAGRKVFDELMNKNHMSWYLQEVFCVRKNLNLGGNGGCDNRIRLLTAWRALEGMKFRAF